MKKPEKPARCDASITIRFYADDLEAIRKRARSEGSLPGPWIRSLAVREARAETTAPRKRQKEK